MLQKFGTRKWVIPLIIVLISAGAFAWFASRRRCPQKILIASGAPKGRYFEMAILIRALLGNYGIKAEVLPTDGSVENLKLLKSRGRSTLALMQFDVAFAAHSGIPLYGDDHSFAITRLRNMQRIANLGKEKLYVVTHKDLKQAGRNSVKEVLNALNEDDEICIGPDQSGTQAVARSLLGQIKLANSPRYVTLSVRDMISQLISNPNGKIKLGFFVTRLPSAAFKQILNNDQFRILSIDPDLLLHFVDSGYTIETISPGDWPCVPPDEGDGQTIETSTVLMTTEAFDSDVYTITKAIVEGEVRLNVGGREAMVALLSSLPLHPDAERYYKQKQLIPSISIFEDSPLFQGLAYMLNNAWKLLAILVIMAGGLKAIIELKRAGVANRLGTQVLAVPIGIDEPNSVTTLTELQRQILEHAQRRWWQLGELDKPRWRYLHDLIVERIKLSKENLTRAIAAECRAAAEGADEGGQRRRDRFRSIEARISEYFEKGELDAPQRLMLHQLVQENAQ